MKSHIFFLWNFLLSLYKWLMVGSSAPSHLSFGILRARRFRSVLSQWLIKSQCYCKLAWQHIHNKIVIDIVKVWRVGVWIFSNPGTLSPTPIQFFWNLKRWINRSEVQEYCILGYWVCYPKRSYSPFSNCLSH